VGPLIISLDEERESNLKIILGDNSTHPVKGLGSVKFHLDSEEPILLHDVMYVLGLKKNSVSIYALEEKGMRVAFIKGKLLTWPIGSSMRNAFPLGSKFEGLYTVTRRPLLALVHHTNHLSEPWHRRLAHLHYDALPKLKKLVFGIPDVQAQHDGVCPGCASGKKTRGPFPSRENKTNDMLQLIHSGICGPILIHSIGGHLYYITFIDDFSRKTRIYYLKHKDEAFEMFKEFKALVENLTRKKNKIFRYNNGVENISNDFINFCKKKRIKKEMIVPYNPKQNGVAKRKNRSIVEVARAMLHDQKLSKFLSREAKNVAVYVQNRVPHQALDNKTPEEVFIGVKPDVSHLCIFGCPVYFHVPKDKRNKLETMGRKGTFIGYCENSKAFRIYILGQRKVEICRDVTFDKYVALGKARDIPLPPPP